MAKTGRPTKYDPKYHIPWARGLALRGATAEEIAREFGVAKSTLYKWAKEDEAFSNALNESRDIADMDVERTLYQRATGGKSRETKKVIEIVDGQPQVKRVEETERELAPDVTACIFWLKNRQPQLWRDRQDVAISEEQDASIKEWIDALGLGKTE